MTYVLIMIVGVNSIFTQDFNSKQSCEAAIEFVRDNVRFVVMECVPK